MKTLKRPFHQVDTVRGMFYGGSQAWFPYRFLKNTGCGVVSASDLILHIRGKKSLTQLEYVDFAKHLWKYYLPVIPGFGMNGLTLMIGLNRYFVRAGLPYRACWMLSAKKMISRIEKMLENDIPAILAIGPNFPLFWKKEMLCLYRKEKTGMIPATKVKAHFVTVTGIDQEWIRISSWGKEYYIKITEFEVYSREKSSSLISNIIYVKNIKKDDSRRFKIGN